MKIEWNKKYTTVAVYVFLTAAAIFMFLALFIFGSNVFGFVKKTLSYLSPVIYGIIIAYLLLPVDRKLLRFMRKLFSKCKAPHPKLCKTLSLVCTYIIFLGIMTGFVFLVLPEVGESVTTFSENIPTYYTNITNYIKNLHIPFLDTPEGQLQIEELIGHALSAAKDILPKAYETIYGIVTEVVNVLIGLLISVYVLAGRGHFKRRSRKLLFACFKPHTISRISAAYHEINRAFGGYIRGSIIDATIVGIVAFCGFSLIGIPSPVLISLIIAVTNVIPVFGPFIGAIPSGLIVLAMDPSKAIWFVVFIIALQQIDGNLIAPKILGGSTGLPSFWVIFSLLLFGGFFGVIGMLIAVPTFALIFSGIKRFAEARLKKKGMPTETEEYRPLIEQMLPEYDSELSHESEKPEAEPISEKADGEK